MDNNKKSFDLIVEDTKESVIKVLNESTLPITVISMILKEINNIVDKDVSYSLQRQREEYNTLSLGKEDRDGNK